MVAKHTVSDKPLDFSFLKLTEVAQLRKEQSRSGKRKAIVESDEEDDVKKVSYTFKQSSICLQNENANALPQIDQGEDQKEKETREIVIRA